LRLRRCGLFAVGFAFVAFGILGGTTWASGGFWAPDGAYARFVWALLGIVWVVVVTRGRSGLVVAISSTAGIVGQEFCTAYAASKFGIEGWMLRCFRKTR
jgi:NAD(P)-dependent dehydrogenase (short-subunit alcohol dehydrogenase family)